MLKIVQNTTQQLVEERNMLDGRNFVHCGDLSSFKEKNFLPKYIAGSNLFEVRDYDLYVVGQGKNCSCFKSQHATAVQVEC